jgi:hypothetical protein
MKQFGTIIAPASIIPGSASVTKSDDGATVIGFTIGVLVLSGEFANTTTTAIISAPIGSEVPNMPAEGTTLLVAFTEGVVDRGCYVIGQIPGGVRPIPTASAGIAVDEGALATTQVRQPPKGVGVREYVRGAPFVIRLKGALEGYAGELYIEADDADQSTDGNGTFIRLTRIPDAMSAVDAVSGLSPVAGKMAIKLRTAQGASIEAVNDHVTLRSGDGLNSISVSNQGILINGKRVGLVSDEATTLDGGAILVGYAKFPIPPNPVTDGVVRGTYPAIVPSLGFFIAPGA